MSISIFDSICPQYGSALLVPCFEPSKYSSDKYFSTLHPIYKRKVPISSRIPLRLLITSSFLDTFWLRQLSAFLSLQLFGIKICSRHGLLTVHVHAVYFFFVFEYMSEDIINTDLVGWLCFDHSFYYNIFILETKAQ
jgi:hypothetical protein